MPILLYYATSAGVVFVTPDRIGEAYMTAISPSNSLVIIPCYQEAENIAPIITAVWEQAPELCILVVDDNSPDGTADIVRHLQKKHPKNLFLLSRSGKLGLASAYIDGFRWGLDNGFQALIEMDADFSHSPSVLPKMISLLNNCEAVVGSRYVPGGSTENWSPLRKLISKTGSLYARLILGVRIRDLTGGYNAWTRKALELIDLKRVESEGYSFQIELKYRCLKKGGRLEEIPITFSERREGFSKMSFGIVLEALWRVWLLKLDFKKKVVTNRIQEENL